MSDYPPPPGDGERPFDPQYAYPQYPVFPEPGARPTMQPSAPPPPQPPPRKNRTGVVVAVAAAVVVGIVGIVLALVAVTGTDTQRTDLALPIPTDTGSSQSDPGSPPTAVAPDPGTNLPSDPSAGNEAAAALAATEAGIQYFSALQTRDPDELSALLCRGTPATHTDDLADIVDAEPTDRAYVTGSQATMGGEILLDDGTGYGIELTLAAAGSAQTATGWCVQREAKR